MRILLLVGVLLIAQCIVAQPTPPSDIYNESLRTWLKSNWYDGFFSDLGYSQARQQMYGYVDEVNGEIECIYTGFQQNASFTTFPNPINAEHIVPQSFYGSASPMRSDIHNIRPTHGSANSARANYPFAEINDASAVWYGTDINGNYLSTTMQPGNSDEFSERGNNEWEPKEENKGDVARHIFYFYTMYPTQAGPITDVAELDMLYDWHLNDPVSAQEIIRNNRAEIAQGNRNPYVDYPGLVYDAWFWVAINGCTDPTATNFDPAATVDDGSCDYFVEVLGCTYEAATNYMPSATVDDGSCLFVEYINGCTYPDAQNYNPSANFDDGSCQFQLLGECPGDINNDGAINTEDVLVVLSGFGLPCD